MTVRHTPGLSYLAIGTASGRSDSEAVNENEGRGVSHRQTSTIRGVSHHQAKALQYNTIRRPVGAFPFSKRNSTQPQEVESQYPHSEASATKKSCQTPKGLTLNNRGCGAPAGHGTGRYSTTLKGSPKKSQMCRQVGHSFRVPLLQHWHRRSERPAVIER